MFHPEFPGMWCFYEHGGRWNRTRLLICAFRSQDLQTHWWAGLNSFENNVTRCTSFYAGVGIINCVLQSKWRNITLRIINSPRDRRTCQQTWRWWATEQWKMAKGRETTPVGDLEVTWNGFGTWETQTCGKASSKTIPKINNTWGTAARLGTNTWKTLMVKMLRAVESLPWDLPAPQLRVTLIFH